MEAQRKAPRTSFGPNELATRTRQVARAHARDDHLALRTALLAVGATALRWLDEIDDRRSHRR
jgi:hypothetical protein